MVDNIRKRALSLLASLVISAYNVNASAILANSPSSSGEPEHKGRDAAFIAQACMIPALVILSGVFAGLTLGYMSLDETQLRVLSISGTDKQREYAKKIEPIRKNGHLLLVTLLLGNMIVNETLPVLSSNVLGDGLQAVVISTVLIVVFAEIIPQSLCCRFGLQIGAFMVVPTQILICVVFVVAWPIAKLLEFALGPHHGIVYRRDELKELINMHSAIGPHGGDLQSDTITMVGGALDFQEKTVFDAMTPINDVFMLSIESRLDYETLAKVVRSGHSRVPVFEESAGPNGHLSKKIIGILLVKQCVLLDPEDATPLRDIPLNTVPMVPFDEPLLHTLDRFQQGNSHMAVVSRIPSRTESKDAPGSVNEEAKVGLTRRFLNRVGFGDDTSSSESSSDEDGSNASQKKGRRNRKKSNASNISRKKSNESSKPPKKREKDRTGHTTPPAPNWMHWARMDALEQTMPSDAVLPDANANEFLAGLQRAPLGIITLEDVLEELIGEEILDEFDLKGPKALPASSYVPAEAQRAVDAAKARAAAKNNNLNVGFGKEKSDPLGVAPTGTPSASATNLRIAQGLRAMRLKAGGSGSPSSPSGAGTPGAGAKRVNAPSPLSGLPTILGDAKPAISAAGDLVSAPLERSIQQVRSPSAPPVVSSSVLASATSPRLNLSPPPFTAITDSDTSKGIPIARGGSKGAKKRVFKSPIAGGSATPGLEKRADPAQSAKAAPTAVGASVKSDAKSRPKSDTAPVREGKGGDPAAKDKPREPNVEDENTYK